MSTRARQTTKSSKTKKTVKKDPTPTALLKKVASVSDSTKTLSKEIRSMTKIFTDNQKILVSMKNMIDSLTSTLEHIQKQSRQVKILEEDTQKLFSGLNQIRGQSNIVTKIHDQTARLQVQVNHLEESQKAADSEKISQKISQSMDSINNNSQMIIKISQRIDEVRDDLRKVSAKPQTSPSVAKDLDDIKRRITSISENAVQIESLNGVIEGLKQQFQTISTKSESLENLTAKTNSIEQKISNISDLVRRYDASASEFHQKTDNIFQELQGLKNVTSKAASNTSKEMMALLKLSEYQSNIRMNSESKYGETKDLENMASQTTQIINLFDKLSIEAQEKMPIPHEVRQWAVSKIFDCADKWEIRFSDVLNILTNKLGRDLLKESIRIKQVRDIYGIRAVDEIRNELNIS
ncbi:MAG: chemotaxis protein [Thaumarchaeota archaeon]|nr:chemotaxis protein [Nitrososphaerota archaeon]